VRPESCLKIDPGLIGAGLGIPGRIGDGLDADSRAEHLGCSRDIDCWRGGQGDLGLRGGLCAELRCAPQQDTDE
jgi:hypothetical protein